MSNYTKSTNFTAKDALPTGDAGKIVRGTEIDAEFTAISTAIASKADSASPTFTGTLTASGLAVTGSFTLGGVAVTSTAAELNILDGVTATAAELNILDGVTATAAELNALDGITATVTELNYTDGVTSSIQTQLNTKAPLASPAFTGTVTVGGLGIDSVATDVLRVNGSFFFDDAIERFGIKAYSGVTASDLSTSFVVYPDGASYLIGNYNTTSSRLFVNSYNAGANNTFPIRFFVNGTERGYIQASSTGTVYNTSSDERLKENIQDAPEVTEKLSQIRIREFDWKEHGQHQDYGVIAQEVREVFPDVVSESPEGMYSVDYSRFVPMLIKEIQTLRQEVDALKAGA